MDREAERLSACRHLRGGGQAGDGVPGAVAELAALVAGRPSDYFDRTEGDLPPVHYRKQADSLTERYADLVRSAMGTPG